jgi:uncharacterized repeat protein (TIGR01451 family)
MGSPTVQLEVTDTDDPVQLGEDVTYRITVSNQGSEGANNILVEARTTPNMEVVSVGGATEHQIQGQIVDFAPIQSLAPGEQASWQVTAKAQDTGETRIQVRMTNDQIEEPLQESETTRMFE